MANPTEDPAFTFGRDYANDVRYRDRDWASLESDIRRDWEARDEGAWEKFKESIRVGWDHIRGRTD